MVNLEAGVMLLPSTLVTYAEINCSLFCLNQQLCVHTRGCNAKWSTNDNNVHTVTCNAFRPFVFTPTIKFIITYTEDKRHDYTFLLAAFDFEVWRHTRRWIDAKRNGLL